MTLGILTPEDRAVLAVKEFNRIRSNLSSFASSIAGKKVNIKASANTYTDGSNIYLRPPSALASRPQHDRNLCYERGPDGQELCKACYRIDQIYTALHHEIGHLVFGSLDFVVDTRDYRQPVIELMKEYVSDEYAEFIDSRYPKENILTAVKFAHSIGPTIGHGWNIFEDVRMEKLVGRSQPGFITMSWAMALGIMINGIESEHGYDRWSDKSFDEQVHVVWLLAAQGHEVEKYFATEVTEPVREFIDVFSYNINTPMDSAIGSAVFYGFMKQRGFFKDEDGPGDKSGEGTGEVSGGNETSLDADDENPSNSEGSSEDEGSSSECDSNNDEHDDSNGDSDGSDDNSSGQDSTESSSNDRNGSNSSSESNQSDSTGDSAGPVSEDQSNPSGEDDSSKSEKIKPPTCGINHNHDVIEVDSSVPEISSGIPEDFKISDEDLNSIIIQAEYYDEYCDDISGVDFFNPIKYDHDIEESPKPIEKPDLKNLAPSLLHARRIFSDTKLDKHYRNLKKGKLDPGVLGKRAWSDDERLFKRKERSQGIDFEVCIGMDLSSSTAFNGAWKPILRIGYSTAELLSRLDVKFSLYGHKTGHDGSGIVHRIGVCKTVNEPWADTQKNKCLSLVPDYGSLDGHNLEIYRKILERSRARKKLLIYFTDGVIPETNKAEELPILQKEIAHLKRLNIAMVGIGILTDSPKDVGMDTVHVPDPRDLKTVIKEIEKRVNKIGT